MNLNSLIVKKKKGDITLNNTGIQTIFIAKFDNDGTPVWAKAGAGSSMDMAQGIVADDFGNVYVTGYMDSSTLTFDGIELTNNGENDIFLVQYGTNGEIVFAENYGGSGLDAGKELATDVNGNIYLLGGFASASISLGDHTVSTAGGNDVFLAKINSGFVGIDDVFQTNISLFPNPSNGVFVVENNEEIQKITVYNFQGKLVFETAVDKRKAEIDMSSFSNGVYMVNIESNGRKINKKLVLAR